MRHITKNKPLEIFATPYLSMVLLCYLFFSLRKNAFISLAMDEVAPLIMPPVEDEDEDKGDKD